jgi:hypothetical protein
VTNVADLRPGGPDALGEPIQGFFGRKPPHYAVYSVRRRVAVHFADDGTEADRQRKALAELAPLRGEIDGLIDGWRDGSSHSFFGLENAARLRTKADRYERRVGDALVVALEIDVDAATQTLNAIKHDIINERTAWARFEYLIAAFGMAMTVMFIAFLVTATYPFDSADAAVGRMAWVAVILVLFAAAAGTAAFLTGRGQHAKAALRDRGERPFEEPGGDISVEIGGGGEPPNGNGRQAPPSPLAGIFLFLLLALPIFAVFVEPSFSHTDKVGRFATPIDLWRAAAAGAVGAFFSIAIGIRTRTVLPDLLRTSNIMDAVLRVTIGFIAGAVLMAMLRLDVVTLQIGPDSIPEAGALAVILAGFFAGFSERLVPDLLEKAKASPGGSVPRAAAASGSTSTTRTTQTTTETGSGTTTTTTSSSSTSAGGSPVEAAAGEPDADPAPEQAGEDACASDIDLEDEEVAADSDLPPATGGVERPSEGGNP